MPNLLPMTLIFAIWFGSALLAGAPFALAEPTSPSARLTLVALIPMFFALAFPLLAGVLSQFGQKGITKGKFPRKALHPVYLLRRVYGVCWTQVYYFKPVYSIVLAVPALKFLVFRLFGYKASCDFTVYPDTWIRDLPILNVGAGAYLSNRATIGTNICLPNGTILVDTVSIGEKALIGHLAVLAPGSHVGSRAEVGISCIVGLRAKIFEGARLRPRAGINHGAIVGENADIGADSYVGMLAEIGPGIKLPAGSNIPSGTILRTQEDVQKYHNAETEKMVLHREALSSLIMKYVDDVPRG